MSDVSVRTLMVLPVTFQFAAFINVGPIAVLNEVIFLFTYSKCGTSQVGYHSNH
jgi:hypothetical protein